jgi:hypothetical protein
LTGSTSVPSCYVTYPSLHIQWEAEKQEKTEVQREKAEKEAQKATEDTAHEVQICVEVATRTFAGALLSSILIPFLTFFQIPWLHTSARTTSLCFLVHSASE